MGGGWGGVLCVGVCVGSVYGVCVGIFLELDCVWVRV